MFSLNITKIIKRATSQRGIGFGIYLITDERIGVLYSVIPIAKHIGTCSTYKFHENKRQRNSERISSAAG